MDLLIVEPLEAEVLQWLDARHELFYAPRLATERDALHEALADVRAAFLPPRVAVTAATLAQAPRLRAIGRVVGGPENIDLGACTRAGIEIVRSQDATAPAEAEFMLGALLALLRPSPEDHGRVAGRELGGATVGLVGLSPGARTLARLLQGIGSRLVGYDPGLHANDGMWSRCGVQPVGLRDLFEQADAVCVTLSFYSRYQGLIGERCFELSKPGQVLVSVASGGLFDEDALARSLRGGRLAAAWLDNLAAGALEEGHPLHDAPGLLVTPRLSAYTREARMRSAWTVARRVDEILRLAPRGPRRSGLPAQGTMGLARQAAAARAVPQAAVAGLPVFRTPYGEGFEPHPGVRSAAAHPEPDRRGGDLPADPEADAHR